MPRKLPSGETVSAGVDWLTCTVQKGPGMNDLVALAHELLNARKGAGFKEHVGRLRDYRTVSTDGLMIGERDADTMIQVTGEVARHEWTTFARIADNISRIDVEVTAELPDPDVRVARNAIRQGMRHAVGRPGRPPQLGHIQSWEIRDTMTNRVPAGATAYVGSPSSDFRVRIYDKGAESGTAEAGRLWRYELQLRRDNAKRVARELMRAADEQDRGDMMRARQRVFSEVKKRGITPRFRARDVIPIETKREPTDQESWEEWVRMIGPAILRRGTEFGRSTDEIAALLAGYRPQSKPEPQALRAS